MSDYFYNYSSTTSYTLRKMFPFGNHRVEVFRVSDFLREEFSRLEIGGDNEFVEAKYIRETMVRESNGENEANKDSQIKKDSPINQKVETEEVIRPGEIRTINNKSKKKTGENIPKLPPINK